MHGIAYVSALLLAGVFAAAGAAKLRSREATVRSFRFLGLPRRVATVVPLVELLVAGALLLVPEWGAALALPLLALFTTFLVRAVRRGVTAPCNCFGSSRTAPVSGVEVARNIALLTAAVVALTADGPTRPGPIAVGLVLVATAAVATGLRVAGAEGPHLRRPAPALPDASWPGVVAFLSPGCPRCELDRPAIEARNARVITLAPETAPTFRAWRVRATPYYVTVDLNGVVRARGDDLERLPTAT